MWQKYGGHFSADEVKRLWCHTAVFSAGVRVHGNVDNLTNLYHFTASWITTVIKMNSLIQSDIGWCLKVKQQAFGYQACFSLKCGSMRLWFTSFSKTSPRWIHRQASTVHCVIVAMKILPIFETVFLSSAFNFCVPPSVFEILHSLSYLEK